MKLFAVEVDAVLREPCLPVSPCRIDPNRARVAELALLPGLGPARAEAIVLARVRHGPIRSLEDFARIEGIGPALAARLRDWLELGEPAR